MGNNIKSFNERDYVQVIRAYLIEAKSHRQIQEEILGIEAPSRGGGFVAMEILHHFGISGSKKGILKKSSLDEEYLNATGSYKQGLDLLKRY
jgi:hypothetical protein